MTDLLAGFHRKRGPNTLGALGHCLKDMVEEEPFVILLESLGSEAVEVVVGSFCDIWEYIGNVWGVTG